ncbi:hypothetical protein GCM10010988_18540 [Cnuibacter physcomitrellae]|nr:hypothetical protein GCM10010988_18540 [Cnuibacter physcomitrellae]
MPRVLSAEPPPEVEPASPPEEQAARLTAATAARAAIANRFIAFALPSFVDCVVIAVHPTLLCRTV